MKSFKVQMRTLGRSLHKLLKPMAQRHGFIDARLFSQWGQIIGAEMAQKATPQKLKNGTLTLAVPSGAAAMEVQHQALQLMERINSHFGYRAVERLRPVQLYTLPERTPVYREKPLPDRGAQVRAAAQVESVRDDHLRQALERLGARVEMQHSKPI